MGSRKTETAAGFPPATAAWTVWGLGAALYLIGFYQRVAPAVMAEELAIDFALGAASLGNLSAFYFYSYVAMQIPTGILADRWGPRRLLAAGGLIAGAGTLVFALAPTLALAPLALAADEWRPLFNGTDLTGWKTLGGKASFQAEDGVIVGTAVPDSPNSSTVVFELFETMAVCLMIWSISCDSATMFSKSKVSESSSR